MLKIAIVANTYQQAKLFVESKFADSIVKIVRSTGVYTLSNGDEIYLCYGGEDDKDRYKGMIFDCFIVHPAYETLLDVIRYRTTRS